MDEVMAQLVGWGVLRPHLPAPQVRLYGLDAEQIEEAIVEWEDRERFARTNRFAAWTPEHCRLVINAARLTLRRAVAFGFEPSV
jgi:hypothetical protein